VNLPGSTGGVADGLGVLDLFLDHAVELVTGSERAMPDRILITTDDLEHAVRINAGVEAAAFHTTLAHTLDEARQALRRDPPPTAWS